MERMEAPSCGNGVSQEVPNCVFRCRLNVEWKRLEIALKL